MWLANGIPEEIGCMCWQVELGVNHVCGWSMAFLGKLATCAGK